MNAKCKKFLTMLLLVCVSIGAAGCSAYSNQRYYERAQTLEAAIPEQAIQIGRAHV